ncbi:hypothetical protein STEG23_000367, partial [Scotinomys teguina]
FSVVIGTRNKTIRPCLGLQDIRIFHPDVDGGFCLDQYEDGRLPWRIFFIALRGNECEVVL